LSLDISKRRRELFGLTCLRQFQETNVSAITTNEDERRAVQVQSKKRRTAIEISKKPRKG
jgi:hypothetical protein